jgi:hypothetical protein
VITNREIRDEDLLDEALDEVTTSAVDNGVAREAVAAALREHAAAVAEGEEG